MKTYTAPIFVPIKLDGAAGTPGGTAGGCAMQSIHDPYICPVDDYELGETFFNDGSVCTTDGGDLCYYVPHHDHNVYTS